MNGWMRDNYYISGTFLVKKIRFKYEFQKHKDYSVDSPELSAMFLENVAQYAVYWGMPELLEYAFAKDLMELR